MILTNDTVKTGTIDIMEAYDVAMISDELAVEIIYHSDRHQGQDPYSNIIYRELSGHAYYVFN